MKLKPAKIIFYLAMALILVAAAVFLLTDNSGEPDYSFDADRSNYSSVEIDKERPVKREIIYYPANPAPGDFLILEAGPLHDENAGELPAEFILPFPGEISEYYRAGNLLYVIIAIGFDTQPDIYPVSLVINTDHPDGDTLVTEITIVEKDFSFSRFRMPPDRTAGWTAARLAEDREKLRLARETTEPYPLWPQTFVLPLEGPVTSQFGAIRVINDNPPRRHTGIDIAADEGAPVVTPGRGIVRLADYLLAGGNSVIIDHGLGISSAYMHLHTIAVEEGQVVNRGELIGTVGMTGYATGNHLHWEVNIGQTPVNPQQLLQNELLWIAPAYADAFISTDR